MDTMVRKEDYDLDCIRAISDIAMKEILDEESVSNVVWAYSVLISTIFIYRQEEYNDNEELCVFLDGVSDEVRSTGNENILEFIKFVHTLVTMMNEDFEKIFIKIKKGKSSVIKK